MSDHGDHISVSHELMRIWSRLRLLSAPLQDRVATALGVNPNERGAAVVSMLESNVRRAPGYWVQLFIATGIATLGLALDSTAVVMLIALFCALMATYTTIRQTTDTTAAAAGTAIGIALVPPLCVAGIGIGNTDLGVAGGRGASLLFVANFSAIVVSAVIVFLLLGYARVDAGVVEQQFVGSHHGGTVQLAERAHAALGRASGSQYGVAMRLLVPALFRSLSTCP